MKNLLLFALLGGVLIAHGLPVNADNESQLAAKTGLLRVALPPDADSADSTDMQVSVRLWQGYMAQSPPPGIVNRETDWKLELVAHSSHHYDLRLDDASREAGFWLDPSAVRIVAGETTTVHVRSKVPVKKTGNPLEDGLQAHDWKSAFELSKAYVADNFAGSRRLAIARLAGYYGKSARIGLQTFDISRRELLSRWTESRKHTLATARLVGIHSHLWLRETAPVDLEPLLAAVRGKLARRPSNWRARDAECGLLYRMKRFDEALEAARLVRGMQDVPQIVQANALHRTAAILYLQGKSDEAWKAHEAAYYHFRAAGALQAGPSPLLTPLDFLEAWVICCESVNGEDLARTEAAGRDGAKEQRLRNDERVQLVFTLERTSLTHAVDVGGVPEVVVASHSSPAQLLVLNVQSGVSRVHTGGTWIRSLAVSPDGQTVAAGRSSGVIDLINPVTGAIQRTLAGQGKVNGLAFSADGRHLVSSHQSGRLVLWQVAEGRAEAETILPNQGWAVRFSPDMTRLLVSIQGGRLAVWRPRDNTLRLIAGDVPRAQAAWLNDELIVRPTSNGQLAIQHVESGRIKRTIPHQGAELRALQPFQGDRFVISGDERGAVQLWDLHAETVCTLTTTPGRSVSELAVSRDSRYIVVGGASRGRHSSPNAVVWKLSDEIFGNTSQFIAEQAEHSEPRSGASDATR